MQSQAMRRGHLPLAGRAEAVTIEVANESGIDVSETELISVARFVIDQMDVNPAAELSIVLLDMAAMADLHMRWMDLPGPTDVMSFPMDELEPGGRPDTPEPGPAMLGDIVLCPEFAAIQAATAGHTLGHELALLTIHGILHLLGVRPRRAGRSKRDVRPAVPLARGVGRRPSPGSTVRSASTTAISGC